MAKSFLIIGHSGYVGRSLLGMIDKIYLGSQVVGISTRKLKESEFHSIHLEEFKSMDDFNNPDKKFDYVFFLAHAQNSKSPISAEDELATQLIDLINRNNISAPIVLILSAGNGSEHLNSRIRFNQKIKDSIPNKIIEIKSSVIASPGSVSYEIPFRCVNRMKVIPSFPWYKNKVSLTNIDNVLEIFKRIIDGSNSEVYFPINYQTTYGDYLKKLAKENDKQPIFIRIPFNEFNLTPLAVSLITKIPYQLVKNLMKSLSVNSIIDD